MKKEIRSFLPKFLFYKKSKKPSIVIYGVRRGGTTWLSEIISSKEKFRIMDQPTEAHSRSHYSAQIALKRKLLPSMRDYQYIFLSNREKLKFKNYFKKIESGGFRILDHNFSFNKCRVLYKLLNFSYLSDWVYEEFNFKTVVILRHPIATALSCFNTNWDHDYFSYLDSNYIKENYLNSEMYELARTIDEKGTKIEKYVLEWLLKLQHPLQNMDNYFIVYYEDLVIGNELSIMRLENELQVEIDRNSINKLSGSTVFSSQKSKELLKDNPTLKLNSWISDISIAERNNIQSIFNTFNLKVYNVNSGIPITKFKS